MAADRIWDAVVVGAGPAGAMAARELARREAAVLVVEKAAFPRAKVCGCCVNEAALATLHAVGLGALPQQLGAKPLRHLLLASGGRQAKIPLRPGVVVSRTALDAALIEQAVREGAEFLPQTLASLEPSPGPLRRVMLRRKAEQICVSTRLVVVATGLGRRPGWDGDTDHMRVAARSRIGSSTMVDRAPDFYQDGTIFMTCADGGYVGLVRLEDGQLNVAAAFDPSFMRASGGPGPSAEAIVKQAGLPPIGQLTERPWMGTPALTQRRSRLADERLFVIGDAAGYVEPFTGEGIAWALACGSAVAPLALQAIRRWHPSLKGRWETAHRQLINRRMRLCKVITWCLRRAAFTSAAVGVLSRIPSLASPVVSAINAPLESAQRWATATARR